MLVEEIKRTDKFAEKVEAYEKWEKNSYHRNYEFYCFGAAVYLASCIVGLIQMSEMQDEDHGWSILGIAIATLTQLLVFDIIVVFLARKSQALHKLFILRGYYYDYELENEYMLHGRLDII